MYVNAIIIACLIAAIFLAIAMAWMIIAEYADTHRHCYEREVELSKKIQQLQAENMQYYARYGIIKKDGE